MKRRLFDRYLQDKSDIPQKNSNKKKGDTITNSSNSFSNSKSHKSASKPINVPDILAGILGPCVVVGVGVYAYVKRDDINSFIERIKDKGYGKLVEIELAKKEVEEV